MHSELWLGGTHRGCVVLTEPSKQRRGAARLSCALTLVRFTCALTVLHYVVNLLGLELLRLCGAYEVCTRVLLCECRTQAVLRMHPV